MPSLDALYESYKEEVVFLFVSNESQETISNFITKNNYGFKVHTPITAYPKPFDASAIPRTFVIDKKGYIVIDKTGAANWNSDGRSEEHTSELQSRENLVCRLLLEKKKKQQQDGAPIYTGK